MVDRRRRDGGGIRHREAGQTPCHPVWMHLHEARIRIPAVWIYSSLLNSCRTAQSTQIKTDALDGSESSPPPANSLRTSIAISTFEMPCFHPRQVRVGTAKDQPDQHIPMNVVKPTNPPCILDIALSTALYCK